MARYKIRKQTNSLDIKYHLLTLFLVSMQLNGVPFTEGQRSRSTHSSSSRADIKLKHWYSIVQSKRDKISTATVMLAVVQNQSYQLKCTI